MADGASQGRRGRGEHPGGRARPVAYTGADGMTPAARRGGGAPSLPAWATPRRMALLLAAAIVAVFARSLANGFTYDEPLVIVEPQVFLKSARFDVLFSPDYFGATLEGTWRPFCTFTYMLDALVAFHPAVFKAQSVLWHVAAACLVAALARRLLPEAQRRFALVAGLVFALHPLTTETVDNASFREDSLVTFWTLATLLLSLDGRRRLALVAFALGLLSKESAVVAPVLLALIRILVPGASAAAAGRVRRRTLLRGSAPAPPPPETRTPWAALVRELVPFAVVAVAYLAIRFGPMRTVGQYALHPGGSLAGTMRGMPAVWAHYLKLLALPWPLCADYTGYFAFGAVPLAAIALPLAAVLGYVVLVAVALRRGQRLLAFGLLWFAVALGPVSNFIPVPVPAAERFLTLPLVGIALAVAAAAAALSDRLAPGAWRAARAAGLAVLAVFAVLVNVRHRAWHDDGTLWFDTVAVNPRACGAQSAIGGLLLQRGIAERSLFVLRDAVSHQELALRLCEDARDPVRASMIYTRLGAGQAMLNHLAPARVSLERAIALVPNSPLAVVWLGYVAFLSGDKDAAASLLKHAIIDLGPPDTSVAEIAQWYVDKI